MPYCYCNCPNHDAQVQHVVHTFQALSTSIFNLPSKPAQAKDSQLRNNLYKNFSAVSLVTNDIDHTLQQQLDLCQPSTTASSNSSSDLMSNTHSFENSQANEDNSNNNEENEHKNNNNNDNNSTTKRITLPPLASFSCPSLTNLAAAFDLSPSSYNSPECLTKETLGNDNNHDNDSVDNNDKSSIISINSNKGDNSNNSLQPHTQNSSDSNSNPAHNPEVNNENNHNNNNTDEKPIDASKPHSFCPDCKQICCHQQLLVHEQILTENALSVANIPPQSLTSSQRFKSDPVSPISAITPVTPIAHPDPIALAEVLQFAGLTATGSSSRDTVGKGGARSSGDRSLDVDGDDDTIDDAKARREDFEASKQFLASVAKLGITKSGSKPRPAKLQYTTEIPEIFLSPSKVLSQITKSILVKEKQDIEKQACAHKEANTKNNEPAGGAEQQLGEKNPEGQQNEHNQATSGVQSQREESADEDSDASNETLHEPDSSDGMPHSPSGLSIHEEKGGRTEDTIQPLKSALSKKTKSQALQINHTKPPPSPPVLPAQLGAAFLNSRSSATNPGCFSNCVSKKSTTTLYECNSSGAYLSSGVLGPPMSASSTSASAATFVSPSANSSSTAIGSFDSFSGTSASVSSTTTSAVSGGKSLFTGLSPLSPVAKSSTFGKEGCSNHEKCEEGGLDSSADSSCSVSRHFSDIANTTTTTSSSTVGSPSTLLGQRYFNNPEPPKYTFTNLIDDQDPDTLNNLPSYVTLNHLVTSHLKNNVLAAACTSRYKTKYITQILYRPM